MISKEAMKGLTEAQIIEVIMAVTGYDETKARFVYNQEMGRTVSDVIYLDQDGNPVDEDGKPLDIDTSEI